MNGHDTITAVSATLRCVIIDMYIQKTYRPVETSLQSDEHVSYN